MPIYPQFHFWTIRHFVSRRRQMSTTMTFPVVRRVALTAFVKVVRHIPGHSRSIQWNFQILKFLQEVAHLGLMKSDQVKEYQRQCNTVTKGRCAAMNQLVQKGSTMNCWFKTQFWIA